MNGPRPAPEPNGERPRHVVVLTNRATGRESLTDASFRNAAEAQQEADDWRRAGHTVRVGVVVFLSR